MIVVGESDRLIDDRGAERPRLFHGLDRVRQHVGLIHDGLHGLMQRAAVRGEIVLIFNENDRRLFRIHRASLPIGSTKDPRFSRRVMSALYMQ